MNIELAPNIALANKIESHYSDDVKKIKITQADRVFNAIKNLRNPSQNDISRVTGIARHILSARVKELENKKAIKVIGEKLDLKTKKTVTTYGVVDG